MATLQARNRARKAEGVARSLEAVKIYGEVGSQEGVAKAMGISRRTARGLLNRVLDNNNAVMVEQDLEDLQSLMGEVEAHRKSAKPLSLAAIDRLARLLEIRIRLRGTAAPTKSISAHISARQGGLPDYGPAAHPRLWSVHEACVDLTDQQVAEVVRFAKSLPRDLTVLREELPEWMQPKTLEGEINENS